MNAPIGLSRRFLQLMLVSSVAALAIACNPQLRDGPEDGGDIQSGEPKTATIPGSSDTLVRYRVLANRAGKMTVVRPRLSDPVSWAGYFVSPAAKSSSRQYHLFVSSANWAKLDYLHTESHLAGYSPQNLRV